MAEMVLPQFGMGMADGTIIAWHKVVGEVVQQGERLCDVEAAKTTVEVGATCSGVLRQILVAAGKNVPVNTVIAIIGDEAVGQNVAAAQVPPPPPPTPAAPISVAEALVPIAIASEKPEAAQMRGHTGRTPQVEPRARRAARLHKVDLAVVVGTGPGGRIVEEDVTRRAQSLSDSSRAGAAPRNLGVGRFHQFRMRFDAGPLVNLAEELAKFYHKTFLIEAMLARAVGVAMSDAGIADGSIGVRADDGTVKVLQQAIALGLTVIADRLAGGEAMSMCSPTIVVDLHLEDWLDETISFDPTGPASLTFGKSARGADDTGTEWTVLLTCSEQGPNVSQSKLFLKSLRELLNSPVAILV